MHEFFVSYRRRDASLFVDMLAERLRTVGEVFVDVDDLEFGRPFMSRIQEAIAAAQVVVVVIGSDWDASRLHSANDVVAYELRTARRFGRRVVPVVLRPATPPKAESLPADLRWLAELNASEVPEPPQHRMFMPHLIDSLREVASGMLLKPAPAISVPSDERMLLAGEGNFAFARTEVDKDMRVCCSVGPIGQVWLASDQALEVRDATTGALVHRSGGGAEWLQAIPEGVVAAKSAVGYQAPDTIHVDRLALEKGKISTTEIGLTWSWQMPPLALTNDDSAVIAYITTPARRDLIALSIRERGETTSVPFGEAHVESICADRESGDWFALATRDRAPELSRIDPVARSVRWKRDLPAMGVARSDSLAVAHWPAPNTLLVTVGTVMLEVEPTTGEVLRTVMSCEAGFSHLAVDRASSLACVAAGSSLRLWLPDAPGFVSVTFEGAHCRAASLASGVLSALFETNGRTELVSSGAVGPAAHPA